MKGITYSKYIHPEEVIDWVKKNTSNLTAIIHLGGCSSTSEQNFKYLCNVNFSLTKDLYSISNENNIKFIYASSATTYGNGELGFDDEMSCEQLRELNSKNKYGISKNMIDSYIFYDSKIRDLNVIGLKFFNIYGPNEYHKKDMCSPVKRSFDQYTLNGYIKIIDTKTKEYPQGAYRDFIYVKDVIKVIKFFIEKNIESGLYNVGSGQPSSFEEVAAIVISIIDGESVGLNKVIKKIEMPSNMNATYQYYTCASLKKLRRVGYKEKLYSIEEGIKDYIENYLIDTKYY